MDSRSRMGRIINAIFKGLMLVLPYMLRILWIVVEFMGAAFISLLVGIPETSDRLATLWTEELINDGFPPNRRGSAYVAFRILSVLVIFVGWICLSFVTVFIIVQIT